MSSSNLKANIKAREEAESTIKEIEVYCDTTPRFWEELKLLCEQKITGGVVRQPAADGFTLAQCLAFEATIVPYGKWLGCRVDAVPLRYWLGLQESDFNRDLKKWMATTRFQGLQLIPSDMESDPREI